MTKFSASGHLLEEKEICLADSRHIFAFWDSSFLINSSLFKFDKKKVRKIIEIYIWYDENWWKNLFNNKNDTKN